MPDQPKVENPPAPEAQQENQPARINWNEVPEAFRFLEKIVSDSNAEAARYRSERNDLRERLANAKSPEEYAELQKQNAALVRDAKVREVAKTHNVPDDMIEFLTETDDAKLEAQAAKLGRKEPPKEDPVVVTTLPPSGGSNPLGDPNASADGKSEYRKWKENGGLNR